MITMYKDHYQILGISKESTQSQIKSAFRQLSMIHHPDRNKNSQESNKIYRIILNAYKILSDSVKKKEYDEFLKNSSYIRDYKYDEKIYLTGNFNLGNKDILNRINITLWEIDDILIKNNLNENIQKYILIILTFLDKWILEPYGFPDYFMEARKLERNDPREYIKILNDNVSYETHLPYQSIDGYYYDIKRRTDKFISKYEKKAVWEEKIDSKTNLIDLIDRIIEYHNMAIYYLSYLLNMKDSKEFIIPTYEFSNDIYNYDY